MLLLAVFKYQKLHFLQYNRSCRPLGLYIYLHVFEAAVCVVQFTV